MIKRMYEHGKRAAIQRLRELPWMRGNAALGHLWLYSVADDCSDFFFPLLSAFARPRLGPVDLCYFQLPILLQPIASARVCASILAQKNPAVFIHTQTYFRESGLSSHSLVHFREAWCSLIVTQSMNFSG